MNKGTIILLVLCLFAVVAGLGIIIEASAFQKKAIITEGIVADRRTGSYNVLYTSDDGVEHNMRISTKNNNRRDGEKIKVFYRKDNPEKARITDGKKGGRKIIIIALVFLLFDFYMIYLNRRHIRLTTDFKTNGRKVQAEITSIKIDENITIRAKHPFIINCKWTDPFTGKVYTHSISYIWKDPAPLLAGRNNIDVYIDRENPEKYFMDTEFLGVIPRV